MNCPHCAAPNADGARFCGTCGRATSATEPVSDPRLNQPGSELSLIGREIAGRYRIEAKLGEGGMGAVYKAQQTSLKRAVAIKLLRPEVASSPMLLRRFNAEAEAVAKLNHPNTVNIYDFGQDSDGTLFIAMEYLEGQSLRHVVHEDAPLPIRRALLIAQQIAASLTDAHATSIVHRDLKPDNVVLQERGRHKDVVRVLDFGIAKLRDENRQSQLAMTQAGDMLGTPQYMAPEQIRAEQIDGRTDIYALGCMLYEMVTGRLPFDGPTVMSLLSKHLLEIAVAPSQRRPDLAIPPAVDQLVMCAMAKDPRARPSTMEQMGDQIAQILATLPAETQPQMASVPGASAARAVVASSSVAAAFTPPPFAPPPFAPPPFASPPASPSHPAGAVAPAYDPHPYAPPQPQPAPRPQGGSKLALWILLGLGAVGAVGAGVYFNVIDKSPPAVVRRDADVAEADVIDPWAVKRDVTPPPAPVKRVTTIQGVAIDLPDGFVVGSNDGTTFIAEDPRGLTIGVTSDIAADQSPDAIAEEYAKTAMLTIQDRVDLPIAGIERRFFTFLGTDGDHPTLQFGTVLAGSGYRVALIYQVPAAVVKRDQSVVPTVTTFFDHGIHTP